MFKVEYKHKIYMYFTAFYAILCLLEKENKMSRRVAPTKRTIKQPSPPTRL